MPPPWKRHRPKILIDSSATVRGKQELRGVLKSQRLALPAVDRMRAAEAIVGLLLEQPIFSLPGYVAGYWAMGGELGVAYTGDPKATVSASRSGPGIDAALGTVEKQLEDYANRCRWFPANHVREI